MAVGCVTLLAAARALTSSASCGSKYPACRYTSIRVHMPSTSSSGWNWVAYTLAPTRNACTGQPAELASRVACAGSLLIASLCPVKASNVRGSSRSSGSFRPSSVRVIRTGPTGSAYRPSTIAPWWPPSAPMP